MSLISLMSLGVALAGELTPAVEVRGNITGARLGLLGNVRAGVKVPLWVNPESTLFADPYLIAQAEAFTSPAYVRMGGRVTFEPIAIFQLQAYAFHTSYFGNFQTFIGYDDPLASYGTNGDIEQYVLDNPGRQGKGSALSWGVQPTLKAKVGPVLVLLSSELSHWGATSDVPGDYWYEREYELLVGRNDYTLNNNGALLYEWDPKQDDGWKLRVGSLTNWRMALGDTEDEVLRTGLMLTWISHEGKWTHTGLVMPYLRSEGYNEGPPFVGYVVRWALATNK